MSQSDFPDLRSLSLPSILQDCWDRLVDGAHSASHPFHCPTFSTIHENAPEMRTVVLRKVLPDEKTIIIYTDYRSPKVAQIHQNPNAAFLFYDAKSRIQLRIKTIATIHYQDNIAKQRWNESSLSSKKCYLVDTAPSSLSPFPTDGLPPNTEFATLSDESVAPGYVNFAVVTNKVVEIEWLFLHHDGHRRARFVLAEGVADQSWLIP